MSDFSITKEQAEKVITEEIPVIAELIGDETDKVDLTIDDMLNKGISQQAQSTINAVNDSAASLNKLIISPPYDPLKLALMLEINTRLMRACHLRARNTVGLGWGIVPTPRDEDEPEVNPKVYKEQKKKLKSVYSRPNPKTSMLPETMANPLDFSEVMYRMKVDEEATGTGFLEITRANSGQIDGIYNIPSHTIRVLRNGGYVQIRGRWGDTTVSGDARIKSIYFKRFGDPRAIDRDTGTVGTNLPPERRANELLSFVIYSSRSSFYGMPRWISATAAIQGSRLAAIRNIAFFENDAVGRMAIVVSGGSLTSQSVNDIRTFVNREGKGPEKAHRVMVLQAEPRRVVTSRGVGTKIDVVPLTVGIDEDASFLSYRKANDEEVREASGLSSPFFTSEGVNRSSASILRKLTLEQDLIPDMNSHQHVINRTISVDILGNSLSERERSKLELQAMLAFKAPESVDELETAQILGMNSRAGIITINEARREIGLQALPPEFVYGQLPLPLAAALLEAGLLYQGAITDSGPKSYKETLTDQLKAAEAAAKLAQKINGSKPPAQTQKMLSSMAPGVQKQVKDMTGLAARLQAFIHESLGRDIIDAEIQLQNGKGEIVNRIALGDLSPDEEASDV